MSIDERLNNLEKLFKQAIQDRENTQKELEACLHYVVTVMDDNERLKRQILDPRKSYQLPFGLDPTQFVVVYSTINYGKKLFRVPYIKFRYVEGVHIVHGVIKKSDYLAVKNEHDPADDHDDHLVYLQNDWPKG